MIAITLIAIVAVLHLLFGFLEMFARPEVQSKAFNFPVEALKDEYLQLALSNQGIYNLTFGLMTGLILLAHPSSLLLGILMAFVVIVGLYGGMTVAKRIYFVQALPALVAIVLLLIRI